MTEDTYMNMTSEDVTEDRIAALRELFPEAFTEGKVDFPKLKLALKDFTDERPERYGLSWAGKLDAIRTVQTVSPGTLIPVRDESVSFDTAKDMIIEGDNLEVLKLLLKSYHGVIKMIYIDPPYNTGNEFIYPDNFREGLQDYLRYSKQVDEGGARLSTDTEGSGRFHSKWLSMIYPRLFHARNLLSDDGAIFVSIDDNEVHNLWMVMSEIFGEENIIGTFIWKRRSGSNDAKDNVSIDHEYVMVARRSSAFQFGGTPKGFENYKNPDNDPRGPWAPDNLTCNKTAQQRPNLFYPITDPRTGITYQANPNRAWAYEPERMAKIIAEGKVIWPSSPNGTPQYKRHLSEVRSDKKPVSTWIETSTRKANDIEAESEKDGVAILQTGLNQQGTKEFRTLFETQVFDYPKPVSLIKELIKQATLGSGNDHVIILDFFAGSGTTAQAVMELNNYDGGNRQFILVQLPEATADNTTAYHAGYHTIAAICRERVRRVINRLQSNSKGSKPIHGVLIDYGFKAFKLTSSNFKLWNTNEAPKGGDALAYQLRLYADHLLSGRTQEDVLYELLLKAGLPLTSKVEEMEVVGQKVYMVAAGLLFICLEDKITTETLREIIALEPQMVLCLDHAFAGNDQLKTNIVLEMRSHDIKFYTV